MAARKPSGSILPILDDFERALQNMEKATDVNAIKEGVEIIYNKFIKVLKENGVKVIENKRPALEYRFPRSHCRDSGPRGSAERQDFRLCTKRLYTE